MNRGAIRPSLRTSVTRKRGRFGIASPAQNRAVRDRCLLSSPVFGAVPSKLSVALHPIASTARRRVTAADVSETRVFWTIMKGCCSGWARDASGQTRLSDSRLIKRPLNETQMAKFFRRTGRKMLAVVVETEPRQIGAREAGLQSVLVRRMHWCEGRKGSPTLCPKTRIYTISSILQLLTMNCLTVSRASTTAFLHSAVSSRRPQHRLCSQERIVIRGLRQRNHEARFAGRTPRPKASAPCRPLPGLDRDGGGSFDKPPIREPGSRERWDNCIIEDAHGLELV